MYMFMFINRDTGMGTEKDRIAMTGQPGQGSQDKAAKDRTARETKDYSFFCRDRIFKNPSVFCLVRETDFEGKKPSAVHQRWAAANFFIVS
jgi:hypothetical protein